MLLGGHDYATLVALLLKQDELAGGQVEHGDAKGIDERVVGPAHAVRAIGVSFHGDPFDLVNNECRFCSRCNPPRLHHQIMDRYNACAVDPKSISHPLLP